MPGEEPGRQARRGLQGKLAARRSRFRGGRLAVPQADRTPDLVARLQRPAPLLAGRVSTVGKLTGSAFGKSRL